MWLAVDVPDESPCHSGFMTRVWSAVPLLLLGVTPVLADCRAATYVTVSLTTDALCVDLRGTSIATGAPGDIEKLDASTTTERCNAKGEIGTIVVVPSEDSAAKFAVRAVAGVEKSPDACVKDGYVGGCIVGRRILRFIPHTSLTLPIELTLDCLDVPCNATQTCVHGKCQSAEVPDPSQCEEPAGCPFLTGSSGVGGAGGASGGAGGAGGLGPGGGGSGGTSPCPVDKGDCDLDPSNGCETPLTTASDCGACAHDCLGGACTAGVCEPVTIVNNQDTPTFLTADDTFFYWTCFVSGGSIWKTSIDGTVGPRELASGEPWPRAPVVDADALYWVNQTAGGGVRRLALAGGAPITLAPSTNPRGLAVDADNVYFCEGGGQGDILSAPKMAPGPITVVAAQQQSPWGMAVDADNVYFSSNSAQGGIWSIPKPMGMATKIAEGKFAYSIVLDGNELFWVDDNGVEKLTLGDPAPVFLGTANTIGHELAVDATHVYFASAQDGIVYSVPRDPNGMVKTIATGQSKPWGLAVRKGVLAWANSVAGGQVVKLVLPPP